MRFPNFSPKMNLSSSMNDPIYGKSIYVTPCLDLGINECALSPPFPIYTQPCIPVENIDITRRPVAFGRLALPKLRRELHDKDTTVVLAALTSLCDLCHDPEKGYEAIRLRIIDRLEDLTTRPEAEVRERTFLLLKIIAGLGDGKEAIVANTKVLERLKQGLLDIVELVKVKVAICLEEVASFWKTADVLVENKFTEAILKIVLSEPDNLAIIHLSTLKNLMYEQGKEIAFECGAFNVFNKLLRRKNPGLLANTCQCLMVLLSSLKAKKIASNDKFFKTINRLLHDNRPEVYANAASIIMFCTIRTKGKKIASKTNGLAKRLVKISQNSCDESAQIYGLKALTNMCEHETVKKLIKEKYYDLITKIQILNSPHIQRYKTILLDVLNWTPYPPTTN